MSSPIDRRVTPARADLAADHLKGKVAAAAFAPGRAMRVAKGIVPLRAAPSDDAPQESQLLFGEAFTAYEDKDGWLWGQAVLDHYVGYAREHDFTSASLTPTHRVAALGTPLLGAADAKKAARAVLPMNAKLAVVQDEGRFVAVEGGHVFAAHLKPLASHRDDWVAVAEEFLGVPYLWGGKTYVGLDCSGLVQTALEAGGIPAPRDTDMMESALGHIVPPGAALRRGDLVFWKGHVGIMADGESLLHANGFAMQVTLERFRDVRARTEAREGLPIRTIKRL